MPRQYYNQPVAAQPAGPTAAELRNRIDTTKSEAQWQNWLDEFGQGSGSGQHDPNCPPQTPFHTSKQVTGGDASACVDHPDACPPGTTAWGANECVPVGSRPNSGGGTAGGPGGGPGGGGYAAAGGAPQFTAPQFTPPTYEEAVSDPGYQAALREGQGALERSASARGVLRTGGTLKDILDYGQQMGAQQYGNVFNRALQTFGTQYTGAKDEFAPQYGAWQTQYGGDLSRWQTQYGGDLSKYLQREQNIYGLLNQPPPAYPGAY